MTKQNWLYAGVIVLGVLGGLAWFGLTPFLYSKITENTKVEQLGATTVGGTFDTAHQASIVANLAAPGANATSSSILNGGTDRYLTAIKVGCESLATSNTAYTGTGLANLTLTVSTTTTSAPFAGGANAIGGGAINIGTTTPSFVISSTTAANGGTVSAVSYGIWPANTYVTFTTNATNTAVCTFGVDYFSS